ESARFHLRRLTKSGPGSQTRAFSGWGGAPNTSSVTRKSYRITETLSVTRLLGPLGPGSVELGTSDCRTEKSWERTSRKVRASLLLKDPLMVPYQWAGGSRRPVPYPVSYSSTSVWAIRGRLRPIRRALRQSIILLVPALFKS